MVRRDARGYEGWNFRPSLIKCLCWLGAMDVNAILKWWPLLAAVALGLIAWGSIQSDVNNLKERVRQLETRPVTQAQTVVQGAPSPKRVTKGDLCRELVMALRQTGNKDKIAVLTDQIGRMDCYEAVAAAAAMASEANSVETLEVRNAVGYAAPEGSDENSQ